MTFFDILIFDILLKPLQPFTGFFSNGKSGRVNFCPGKLILKLLTWIGEWLENLSEKTALIQDDGPVAFASKVLIPIEQH